jgi:ATP-dependent exoDNAse (exonuclease V) beta subunit
VSSMERLSPEQREVVESWGQGQAVLAGAGCGKTTTLVVKCQELLKRNPEARFAAVSFTEKSAGDIREKLSRSLKLIGDKGALSGHWVMTIHGLCGAIIRENPRAAGFDGEEKILSDAEARLLWDQALNRLWYGDLPEAIESALERLSKRESRQSLIGLFSRVKNLSSFGVFEFFEKSEDLDSRDLGQVGDYLLEVYDKMKRRRGVLDFDDLEKGADRALEDPKVRASYQRRFHLVMVDEFQDTNPMQAKIIWRFVKPDLSNLCVVGDPKQSIYRFRDADVTVFEECCKAMPVRQSLTWNFRSRPGIIDYTNALCEKLFDASGMPYQALEAKREALPDQEAVMTLSIEKPEDLARWIRQEVHQGVPLEDMALLLRRIRGNEKWLKALMSEGIPIAVGSGGLFWEDPRVRELVSFLKWWDQPKNAYSGAVFLRAPWVGVDDEVLDEWVKKDPTWKEPFLESEHALAKILRPHRDRFFRPGDLLLELLKNEKIESELGASVLSLWHRSEELSLRGFDFTGVVRELAAAMDETRREKDVPPPHSRGQLMILTLHSSKGLEFPHVILLDLEKKMRAHASPLLFWDRQEGTYLGKRDPFGDRDQKDPIGKRWKNEEKKKELAESVRLFYVALTRAEERLILVCPENENEYDEKKVFSEDHWRAWVECAPIRSPAFSLEENAEVPPIQGDNEGREFTENSKKRVKSYGRPRHSVTEWSLFWRCPRAYEWKVLRPPKQEASAAVKGLIEDSSEEGRLRGISQTELGTRVHALLEKKDHEGLLALEQEVGQERFLAFPVLEWMEESEWMEDSDAEQGREIWSELNFEVPLFVPPASDEVMVGSMDRLLVDWVQKKAAIVDFKVTRTRKKKDNLLEQYSRQLELYAWALGKLEPSLIGNISTYLVNISPEGVESFEVPLSSWVEGASSDHSLFLETTVKALTQIANGAEGHPQVGGHCRHCEFLSSCAEGQQR